MKITYKHEIKPEDNPSHEEIIDILLKNRGIKNKKEFLNSVSPLNITLSDFKLSREFAKVVKLFEQIKKDKGMIVVYTDYDADGITGGAILWETLHLLGFNAMPFVPHRHYEGYGFSMKGIDHVINQFNPVLIISVDHGITKIKEIEYARSKGIKIIVTDHHLKTEQTPKAQGVFHIPQLSGAGVAYFFAKELFFRFSKESAYETPRPTSCDGVSSQSWRGRNPSEVPLSGTKGDKELLKHYFSCDYLALASIGTVADLVPLTGPSRSIVAHGLQTFSHIRRVGIRHLMKEAGIEHKPITPYEIGFIIAPRINALGRLEHAIDALRLLCTKKETQAFELAAKVGEKNRERQDLVKKAVDEAKKIVDELMKTEKPPKLIVLISCDWHEGIIGLIASKITESYGRPTIVMTKVDGYYKGSGRSIPSFHITDFLRSLGKLLVDVGGHKQAAGFTVEEKNLQALIKKIQKKADTLISDKDLVKTIEADIKIPLSKLSLSLAKHLETLQPFGIGNPQPIFFSEAEIVDIKQFGKKNEHVRFLFKDPKSSSFSEEFVAFFFADQYKHMQKKQQIECVYNLEINDWGRKQKIRGKIKQILL